jgi:hypothetical protein
MKEITVGGKIVPVKDFDMNKLRFAKDGKFLNPRICIIAKSGSGKSWVVRDMLSIINDIPCGVIIAPTDRITKFYDTVFPSSFIHHEYKPEILARLLVRQEMIMKKNLERSKKGKPLIDHRVFLIMDDVQSKKNEWITDPSLVSILCEGRHFGITFCLVLQYSLAIPPELRSQMNFICLLAEDNFSNRRKLYEHYAGIFPKFEIFDSLFTQLTDNYGTMIIDNSNTSRDLNERIFWYKAKIKEPFPIGSDKFIKFHRENYQLEDEKKKNIFDINELCQSKKTNIIVSKVKTH